MFGHLRFVLASLVLFSHTGLHFGPVNPGVLAVVSFYLLAGYVVTHLLEHVFAPGPTRLRRFYAERVLRIFPMYLFICAATLLFAAATGCGVLRLGWRPIVAHLLVVPLNYYMKWDCAMLQLPSGAWPLVPPAWSLGAELQAYFVLPLVVFCRPAKVTLALGSLALCLLAYAGALHPDLFGFRLFPGIFFIFVLGSCVYRTVHVPKHADRFDRWFPLVCHAASLVGLVVLTALGIERAFYREVFIGLLVGLPLVNTLARVTAKPARDKLLGELSYGLFLGHTLATWMLDRAFPGFRDASLPGALAIFALTLAISFIGVRAVERPLFRYRRRLTREPVAAPPLEAPRSPADGTDSHSHGQGGSTAPKA